jgi:hypothetical protein
MKKRETQDTGTKNRNPGHPPGGQHPIVLAVAFLRIQCIHKPEDTREARIHAPQSLGAWTGETSEGLAMEQLAILRNGGAGACGYRYRPGMKQGNEKPKTHPPNPRAGHPT